MSNSNEVQDFWVTISEAEKKSIELGLEDLENGNFVSQEEVMRGAQEIIDHFGKKDA